MMSYSDFPIPKEYPVYMHNSYVLKYFNLYIDHFGLKKHIRFRTEVWVGNGINYKKKNATIFLSQELKLFEL